MMQMLAAGGIEPLCDDARRPDVHNPRGYFELEAIKRLASDATCLDSAAGRAVKVVSALLPELPRDRAFRVIFMHRDLEQVLASQARMLAGTAEGERPDAELRGALARHVEKVVRFVDAAEHLDVLHVQHAEVLASPRAAAERVARFVGRPLRVEAMAAAVDPQLFRQRAPAREAAPGAEERR